MDYITHELLGPLLIWLLYPRVARWDLLWTEIMDKADTSRQISPRIGSFLLLILILLAYAQAVTLKYELSRAFMPTILLIMGWRLFFYANEGNEPTHVHCRKGDMECKYWLERDKFDLEEAFSYNLSSKDQREIKKIIYEHFEYIEQQWDEFQRRRQQ